MALATTTAHKHSTMSWP